MQDGAVQVELATCEFEPDLMLWRSNYPPSWSLGFLKNNRNIGKIKASSWAYCGALWVSISHDSWLREKLSHSGSSAEWATQGISTPLSSTEKSNSSHSLCVFLTQAPELNLTPGAPNCNKESAPDLLQELLGKRNSLRIRIAELWLLAALPS